MRRLTITVLVWLMSLSIVETVHAEFLCQWFGYCVYESPGFKIIVVDKETGKPLADVHALAEWVQYGYQGSGGPLMAIDAVSGKDGVLAFHKWGPISGSSGGLALNQDPVISLFKPGYVGLTINNAPGSDERARVRGLKQDGQTFKMEVFKGDLTTWVKELTNAAFPPAGSPAVREPEAVRNAYLNRLRIIKAEAEKLPKTRKDVDQLLDVLERSVRFLHGDSNQ